MTTLPVESHARQHRIPGQAALKAVSPVAPPPPSIDTISKLVSEDLVAVEQAMARSVDSPVPLVPSLAGHVIAAGGKRIRPLVTILSARASGHGGDRHVRLAASIECIHTATLLHDDVVDNGTQRRGQSSANAIWGNPASVLVGDYLFSSAFRLMVEDGSLEVLGLLSDAATVIAQGEVLQLAIAGNTETDEEAYLQVVRAKTAELFMAAAAVGPIVAGRSETVVLALKAYGRALGTAYQLVDDALDYVPATGNQAGKPSGVDFREGKLTLPVILAYARADPSEQAFWNRTLGEGKQEPDDFATAIEILDRHDGLMETRRRARACAREARENLECLPDGPHRSALADLADLVVTRTG